MLKSTLCDSARFLADACLDGGCGPPRADRPYVISWWCARGYADDSDRYTASFDNLADAEEYMTFLDLDPATDALSCHWLAPEANAIPF